MQYFQGKFKRSSLTRIKKIKLFRSYSNFYLDSIFFLAKHRAELITYTELRAKVPSIRSDCFPVDVYLKNYVIGLYRLNFGTSTDVKSIIKWLAIEKSAKRSFTYNYYSRA